MNNCSLVTILDLPLRRFFHCCVSRKVTGQGCMSSLPHPGRRPARWYLCAEFLQWIHCSWGSQGPRQMLIHMRPVPKLTCRKALWRPEPPVPTAVPTSHEAGAAALLRGPQGAHLPHLQAESGASRPSSASH